MTKLNPPILQCTHLNAATVKKMDCHVKICRIVTMATRMRSNGSIWGDVIFKCCIKPNESKTKGTLGVGWPGPPLWSFYNDPTTYGL